MNAVLSLGKYLFALPFLVFAFFHFMGAKDMAGMVPIPGGAIWVYLTGAAYVLAVVAMFIGRYDKLAMTLLGVLLLVYVFTIHVPGVMNAADEAAGQAGMTSLLKDLMIAGGAWMYASALSRDKSVIG